jgi:hypothetical protein
MGIQAGDIAMSAESRFDIASTGKVFTAACIALLALDGKIDTGCQQVLSAKVKDCLHARKYQSSIFQVLSTFFKV